MEKDYKIKVTDVSELNEQYKEAIQEGTYEGEDVNK
ncbi:NTPase, partial [Campylobacter jejuni]|nr:NTPase [Campylobacter jejuni]EEA6143701.1 NTPase [Campylobacter coli]EAJ8270951.1 NTPase [Campylobacter jejuni]EAK6660936.1 NTPase [Campylobacter jejuni]EAL3409289.1 NTPase [Campylobacter jejuni]